MSIYHISSLCLFHTTIINGFIVEGIGCIKGKYPGKKLLFDGHIDTVPVSDGDGWLYPPFEAEIHDGRIYGRGTSDMKGAVAAMAYAAAKFAQNSI